MARSVWEGVVVDVTKLRDYCLSTDHPRGKHKARIFAAKLGLTVDDAETLRQALLDAARVREQQMRTTERDQFGQRYVLDFDMQTEVGTSTIRSTWIVRAGENELRLTSCYVL